MSYKAPRIVVAGDQLTADNWNSMVVAVTTAVTTATAPVATAGVTDLLVLAAAASATQTPISRRALLGLWRAKS
jgi:hypothetical protein